jgi:iron-sulfur cluster assembly protein
MTMTEAAAEPSAAKKAPIQLTEAAVRQVKSLLAKQDKPGLFLRVGVRGGGCTGLSYVLNIENERSDWDQEYDIDGVPVVIDKKSKLYLYGTTLDFDTSNLMEGGFTFQNPNAAKSCGCGTSFTT